MTEFDWRDGACSVVLDGENRVVWISASYDLEKLDTQERLYNLIGALERLRWELAND